MEKTDTALIVGLDIGTTKVCAVVGEVDTDGQVKIVGIGDSESKGLRKGMVVNIEDTVKSIQQAVTTAGQMAGCDIRSVYVGIAGSHIMGINSHGVIAIQGNEVTTHDVDRVLDAARAVAIPSDREVIHTLPQEYIVDNQRGIVDPIGMAGVRLEVNVHIVTAAVSSAQNIVRSCNRAGLDVADIALESLASAKAVLTDEEREIGVALVDIGGGTSDIAISKQRHKAYGRRSPGRLHADERHRLRPAHSQQKRRENQGQVWLCSQRSRPERRSARSSERRRPSAAEAPPPGAGGYL